MCADFSPAGKKDSVKLNLPQSVATGADASRVYGSETAEGMGVAGAAAMTATYGTAGFADAVALSDAVAALAALEASAQQTWLLQRY